MCPPPSTSGAIRVDSAADLGDLVRRIEQALVGVQAARLRVSGDKITFRGGMLRFSNWNVLLPISFGEIRFTRSNGAVLIHYRVSLVGFFLFVTAMIVAIGLWGGFSSNDIFILPFAWLFLFGGNYFTTMVRFPRFLARAVIGRVEGSADQPVRSSFSDY